MIVAVLSLLACSGAIEGTWMFSRPVAPAPLCADSFNHNLVGAYAPAAEDPAEDTAWTSTDTGTCPCRTSPPSGASSRAWMMLLLRGGASKCHSSLLPSRRRPQW